MKIQLFRYSKILLSVAFLGSGIGGCVPIVAGVAGYDIAVGHQDFCHFHPFAPDCYRMGWHVKKRR